MAIPERRRSILLLCQVNRGGANTIRDHVEGLVKHSRHRLIPVDFRGSLPKALDLDGFDGVVLHYSLVLCRRDYVDDDLRARLRRFRGVKLAYVQDEYRHIDNTVEALAALGVDVLFSACSARAIDQIYGSPLIGTVRKETTLTGYVPEALLRIVVDPLAARPVDVGYRARDLSGRMAWLGRVAQEKVWIGQHFARDAKRYGLRVDISSREEDRIYGAAWPRFVMACKATLGTESGASNVDFSGAVQRSVADYVDANPHASYAEIEAACFPSSDGRVMATMISPRCFEAAALRTLLILYPGHYSGILKPGRHYVELAKDHSNMDEVVAILRDPRRSEDIVEAAFHEVAMSQRHAHTALAEQFDRVFDEEFCFRGKQGGSSTFSASKLAAIMAVHRMKQSLSHNARTVAGAARAVRRHGRAFFGTEGGGRDGR